MIIYRATNLINNKVYIGQTIDSLEKRKYKHLWFSKKKDCLWYFHRAIKKYGENNFKWEIIDQTNNIESLNRLEEFYIDLFKNKGYKLYNLTLGGGGSKGRVCSLETRKKIGIKSKGRISPNKGKRMSDNTRKKLSESHKGKKLSEKIKKKISNNSINMHNINPKYNTFVAIHINSGRCVGEWNHIDRCCKELNVNSESIRKGLKNKTKKPNKYIYLYKKDYKNIDIDDILKFYNIKPFVVLECKNNKYIGKWNNIQECSKNIGIDYTTIRAILNKKVLKPRKYLFKYV